jgi:hypothetical protein
MKRWLLPVLTLATIALVTTLPLTQHLGCAPAAFASQVRHFGRDGSSGRPGRDGQAGRPGAEQTVWADGSPRQIFTAGGDGQDGRDGDRGQRGDCDNQPRNVRYDLQAADGGDGGRGGDGGNGGNGGRTLIYYQDPAALRQIYVDAQGGRGGRGGRGGEGATGCRCRYEDWTVQTCTGTPGTAGYSCQSERFFCRDGEDGDWGRSGRDGNSGQPGQVWLVNRDQPLLSETPSQTLSLASLADQTIALSKNLWQQRGGILSRIAPGSIVASDYQEYVGRVEGAGRLVWDAPRSPNAFAGTGVTLAIQDTGAIAFNFPSNLWVLGDSTQEAEVTTFRVTQAVQAAEATQLAWGTFTGQSSQLTLAVLDLAAVSDYVDTQFHLTLRTADGDPNRSRRLRYITRYDGPVPANLITRNHNRFEVAVGRLPIDRDNIRRGYHAEIELRMTRSLGSNSASQTLDWQGQL